VAIRICALRERSLSLSDKENAGAKPAKLSESEFPEFYNSQNKNRSPFISHSFLFAPTAIL